VYLICLYLTSIINKIIINSYFACGAQLQQYYFSEKNFNLERKFSNLTLNLLTTTIVAPPSNASNWQMGFNSAFKGLTVTTVLYIGQFKTRNSLNVQGHVRI
jgi:hypothetical protein